MINQFIDIQNSKHLHSYYKEHIEKLLKGFDFVPEQINLRDNFRFNDIRTKASKRNYETINDFLRDLSKCVRFIEDGTGSVVLKSRDSRKNINK